jgi:hypothetical protein
MLDFMFLQRQVRRNIFRSHPCLSPLSSPIQENEWQELFCNELLCQIVCYNMPRKYQVCKIPVGAVSKNFSQFSHKRCNLKYIHIPLSTYESNVTPSLRQLHGVHGKAVEGTT